jgi:hypothetical protein
MGWCSLWISAPFTLRRPLKSQGDFDPCSLYVTSLLMNQLWRVGAGILGTEK